MYAKYASLPRSIQSGIMAWLLLALLLSACAPAIPVADGEVLNLFRGTADWIIYGCLMGECGTQIWVKDNLTIYARPLLDGFAFTGEARAANGLVQQQMEGGNFVNWSTWADFRAWMQQNGWTIGSMRVIATGVIERIGSSFTILVLPVGSSLPTFPFGTECDTPDGICNWTTEAQP